MKNVAIVGAGVSGCTLARVLADSGKFNVSLIERRACEIGGNTFDYIDKETGCLVQKYGPHILHCDKEVGEFLSRFCEIRRYEHEVVNELGKSVPFSFDDLEDEDLKLFVKVYFAGEDRVPFSDLAKLSEECTGDIGEKLKKIVNSIFEDFFKFYSFKQWGKEINLGAIDRVKLIVNDKSRGYFTDLVQGIPYGGFSNLFDKMIDSEYIKVWYCNVNYERLCNLSKSYDYVVFTGALDELFDYSEGMIDYRTLDFVHKTCGKNFQGKFVVNYTKTCNFTRISDYSKISFAADLNPKESLVCFEYPRKAEKFDEKYYIVNSVRNKELYNKYLQMLDSNFSNVFLLGRLAKMKYLDIDDAVIEAIKLGEKILNAKE